MRLEIAAFLIVLVPLIELTVLGANSQLLGSLAAVADLTVAGAIVLCVVPPRRFYQALFLPVAIFVASFCWAGLPELVNFAGIKGILPGPPPHHLAPDLVVPSVLRSCGTLALLIAAAMIGYRRGMVRRSLDWLIALGAVNLIIGLLLWHNDPNHVWGFDKNIHVDRFTGTLQNGNAAAATFGLVAIIAMWRAVRAIRMHRLGKMAGQAPAVAILLLAVVAGMIGGCFITGSRTATLLALAMLAVMVLDHWAKGKVKASDRSGAVTLPALAVLLLAVIGLWVAGSFGDLTSARLWAIGDDSLGRLQIWTHYWALAKQSPLYGYGLGSFTPMNLRYLTSPQDAIAYSYLNAAHNQVLQLMLAGGWPFALMQIVATAIIVWRIQATEWVQRRDGLTNAVLIALQLVLLCSMVDIALTVPAISAICAVLLGLLWGRSIRATVAVRPKSVLSEPAQPASP